MLEAQIEQQVRQREPRRHERAHTLHHLTDGSANVRVFVNQVKCGEVVAELGVVRRMQHSAYETCGGAG